MRGGRGPPAWSPVRGWGQRGCADRGAAAGSDRAVPVTPARQVPAAAAAACTRERRPPLHAERRAPWCQDPVQPRARCRRPAAKSLSLCAERVMTRGRTRTRAVITRRSASSTIVPAGEPRVGDGVTRCSSSPASRARPLRGVDGDASRASGLTGEAVADIPCRRRAEPRPGAVRGLRSGAGLVAPARRRGRARRADGAIIWLLVTDRGRFAVKQLLTPVDEDAVATEVGFLSEMVRRGVPAPIPLRTADDRVLADSAGSSSGPTAGLTSTNRAPTSTPAPSAGCWPPCTGTRCPHRPPHPWTPGTPNRSRRRPGTSSAGPWPPRGRPSRPTSRSSSGTSCACRSSSRRPATSSCATGTCGPTTCGRRRAAPCASSTGTTAAPADPAQEVAMLLTELCYARPDRARTLYAAYPAPAARGGSRAGGLHDGPGASSATSRQRRPSDGSPRRTSRPGSVPRPGSGWGSSRSTGRRPPRRAGRGRQLMT